MKRRKRNKNRKLRKQRRPLRFESLEARQMLAVAPWTIDLGGSNSGSGGADLFNDGAGGMLQGEFQSGGPGMGGTIMTSNQTGQNNSPPTAADDTPANGNAPQVNANDGPVDITATLLANDSDADASDTFAISGVSNLAGLVGEVTFEATTGRVLYDPNEQFSSLPDGAIGTDTFTYVITDQQGGTGTATVAVQVTGENDSPVINGPATVAVNQGKTATSTGSFSDPDSGDSVQLSASVGTVTDNGDGTWSWSFFTLEDSTQSQQVTITATDSHGVQSSLDFALAVNYFTPYLTVDNALIEVDEGQTATNFGTFPEPGPDGLTLSASAGSLTHTNDGRWSWAGHTSDGPAQSQVITITATAGGGGTTSTSFHLVVNNVAPSVSVDNAVVEVDEGQTATNSGTFSEPGSDSVTLTASAGSLSGSSDGTWNWSANTSDGPAQSQTVTITFTDSDGLATSTSFDLVVNNVAPSVSVDNAVVEVDEGQTATNSGTFFEPGSDTLTLTASAGSLSASSDGTWNWSADTSDGPAQSQTVTITFTDSDGVATSTAFDLVVNNVAPSVSVDHAVVQVDEGQTATNSGTFFEPGSDTLTLTASAGSLSASSDGTWNWSANTSDGPAQTQTVTITFTDSDGVATSTSFDLVVNNVAPSVFVDNAVVEVDEGQTATNSGTFVEPGSDTLTLTASAGSLSASSDGTWNWSADTSDGPAQTQTVTITFTDSDGAATETTFQLIVNNVAPSLFANHPVVEVDEGQTATNSGTFSDPGADTLTLSASVGNLSASSDGTWSWSADTSDGPAESQTVTITFEDSDGAATSTTFELVVNNVAPSVSVDNAVVEVNEGQTATNSGTFSEPGADSLTLSVSVGGISVSSNGTWNWSFDTSDGPDQSGTVTITAEDSDGAATETTFQLVVNNAAPTVAADNNTVTVNEGQTATNTGTLSDPGADVVTLTASVGAISDNGDGTWSWSFDTSDGPDQNGTVTITAEDSDGASTETTFQLVVNNLAPGVAVHNDTVTVDEGQTAANTGTFSDPGADVVTLTASVGEISDNGDGTWSWSFETSDGPDQSGTVIITAEDSDGADTETTFQLVMNNVAPGVAVHNDTVTVDEGQTAENTGTFSDPGADVVTLTASLGEISDNGDGTWSWSFDSTDGPDQSDTVTITATDSDGADTETTFELIVNNVAPGVAVHNDTVTVDEGQTATNTGTFSDPGADVVTLSASLGDITDNGNNTWSWSFDTSDGPDQSGTVTITAEDSDGSATDTTFQLVVSNVAPTAAVSLNATGNVPIEVSLSELLAGAADPGDDTISLDSIASTSAQGGSITVANIQDENGSFVYTPPAGFEGSDSFTFTVADDDGATGTGTVTINVQDMIWFVDSSPLDPELARDGTLNRPFALLNALNSALVDGGADPDDPGDVIFIAMGNVGDDGSSYDVSHGGETVVYDHFTDGADQDGIPNGWQDVSGGTSGSFATSDTMTTITDSMADDIPALIASQNTFDPTGKLTTIVASIDSITEGGTARVGIGNASLTDQFIVDLRRINSSQSQIVVYGVDGDGVSSTSLTDTFAYSGGETILEFSFDDNSFRVTAGGFDSGEMQFETAFDTFRLSDLGTTVSPVLGSVSEGDPSAVVFDRIIVGPHDIGFVMEEGQIVIGAGAGADGASLEDYLEFEPGDLEGLPENRAFELAPNSQSLPSFSGTNPLIINSTGDVFRLADNNYFDGLSTNAQGSANFKGENIEGLQIFSVVIITSGGGDNNEGVNITGATGTLTISDVQIGGSDAENNGTGIVITGGTATFNFEGVDISQLGGSLIQIVGTDGSTITFDPSSTLTLAGGSGAAVTISGNQGGAVTLNVPNTGLLFDLSGNEGTQTSTPVNDAPWFTIGDIVTVEQDGPLDGQTPITLDGFAHDIFVGPETPEPVNEGDPVNERTTQIFVDEAGDPVDEFTVIGNTGPGLFAAGGAPVIGLDGTLTFTPAAGADGSAEITIQLRDSGGTEGGGTDTAVDRFVISIPVNDPPSFTIAADPPAAAEDSGQQTVAGFASAISVGPEDEADQSAAFHVTGNTNPDLFATGPAIDAEGNLTYTAAADAHGTATITVELQDDGGTANGGDDTSDPQSFEITITPVNDTPAVVAPASANVVEDIATAISGISLDDIDASELTITLSVDSGSLHVSDSVAGGLADGGISNNDSATVTITGTLDEINNTLNDADGLKFTTVQDSTADVTLSINVSDNGQSGDDPGLTGGDNNEQADAVVTLNVTPVNDPPTLGAMGDQTTDEQAELSFTATATDPDLPADNLTFSLDAGAPEGAAIDSETGVFSWTPGEADGPGQFDITVRVTDGGGLSDSENITITVAEVNRAPVLDAIADQMVDEQTELGFTATASDPDLPGNDLTFSLGNGAPVGATIDPASGVFSWTPGEADGPGNVDVTIIVTDADGLSDSQTFTISVGEVNQAPVLDPIAGQTVEVGESVSFQAMATDLDLSGNVLSFSLTGNIPAGAAITPDGHFSWTPSDQQVGSFTFDVVVTDDGQPQLGDSQSVTLTVENVGGPNDDELFTSSILDFARAELDGQTFTFGYFEFEVYGEAVSEDTIIYAQAPESGTFQTIGDGWGWGEIEFAQGDGQSFADFIAPFNGDWTLLVDFNDNFLEAGQQADDGVYHISFDLTGVDENTFFPQATEIDSVTPDAADPRRATIQWTENSEADFMLAIASLGDNPLDGVDVFSAEMPADQISVTTSFLPADSVMTAILGAGFDAGNLATQDGQDADGLDELGVFATTFRTLGFSTAPLVTESVAAGDASGEYAGGSEMTGGVDFSFSGVSSSAEFSSEFFTTGEYEFLGVLFGGQQAVEEMYSSIAISGDTLQVWDLNLEDDGGNSVGFGSATMTVGYDESLLGFEGYDATAADIEQYLDVFHLNPDTGEWQVVATDHDAEANTITFQTDSFSPFVLGQNFDEPGDPPQDHNYSAEIWAGIVEFSEGDGPAGIFAFVEFELNGDDAPVGPDTRVFVQMPGESTYAEFDGWYWEDDHDFDPFTPAIKRAGFDFEVEQGDDDLATFHASLDGTWTVLVDIDGDFDPNNPNEQPDADAKFTFTFDASNLDHLPPAPTITSPVDGTIVNGGDGVTVTWDVATGSMDGVEVQVGVFNEDENLYFEDLAVNGQSAITPVLPSDTPFDAEVFHIDGSGDFAGNAVAVDGFGIIDFDPTASFFASGHATSFMTEPADFAEFGLSLERIEFAPGEIWHQGYLDVFTFDPRHNENTTLWLKQPTDAEFIQQSIGFGGITLDFEQDIDNGQTFAQFVAPLSGTWEVGVDFDGQTDGNNDFDEQFSVTVDLSGFTEASFLDAPTINSPTGTLAAGQRTATIAWDPVVGTDFYIVGVDGSFDTDVPAGTTSFEAQWLPTGGELLAFVGAAEARDDLISLGGGDPAVDVFFYTPTFTPSFFEIPTLTVAVPAGNSQGMFAGGAGVLGGTDWELNSVESSANFKSEYFPSDNYDGQMFLLGEEAHQHVFEFEHPGQVLQIWQVELTDDGGGDVGFDFADLTVSYDQSLLNQPWSNLTTEQLEQGLYLYQFDSESGSWQGVQLIDRDTENNTLTIRTNNLSPLVLGYDQFGPDVEPIDFNLNIASNPNADVDSSHTLQATDLYIDPYAIRSTNPNTFVHAISYADFDQDGDTDVFMASGNGSANTTPAELYLNDGSGNFSLDNSFFDGPVPGMVHPRKALTGDFNGDGKMDVFVLGHGFDQPPFPGEPNSVLLSSENGFVLGNLPDLGPSTGLNHGGASADIDADGDIDILVAEGGGNGPRPFFLINDGQGNFTRDTNRLFGLDNVPFFTAELVDVDSDGFVDLLAAGTDRQDFGLATQILWGDSTGLYSTSKSTVLPAVAESGEVLDIDVADIDGDGDKDIVLNRTGDGSGSQGFYQGYVVQIVEQTDDRQFEDKTVQRLPSGSSEFGAWIDWIRLQDFNDDGHVDIVVDNASRGLIWLNDGSGNFSQAAPLRSVGGIGADAEAITQTSLDPIVDAAIERLTNSGLTEVQAAILESTDIQIADLPDGMLALATATGITIDDDAAGHGWFVDSTPADDLEFDRPVAATERQATSGDAAGQLDLLTAVMHEMGHVLGAGHDHDGSHGLMSEDLAKGTRRLPDWHEFHGIDNELLDLLAHDLANVE